jgi:hypothetical protein
MSLRPEAPITRDAETGEERHPAWGLVGVHRVSTGPEGADLFDSDVRHRQSMVLTIREAYRKRDLGHDYIGTDGRAPLVEIQMSLAQWASFISSPNSGDGVPCTIRAREGDPMVPGVPHDPRLAQSIDEVRGAADDAFAAVQKAFDAYAEKKSAANLRTLKAAIANAPGNAEFAGKKLTEHAESVVQRARADVEAMVDAAAAQRGLAPGDLAETPQIEEGS